ncbi:hypothetical protein IAT38_002131 [Cryptococcus sp. DSM 104549]
MLRSTVPSVVKARSACRLLPRFLSSAPPPATPPAATLSAVKNNGQAVSALFTSPKYNPQKQYRPDGHEKTVTLREERMRLALEAIAPVKSIQGRRRGPRRSRGQGRGRLLRLGRQQKLGRVKPDPILQDPMVRMYLSDRCMCIVTRDHLRADFMVHLRAAVVPPTDDNSARIFLLPDRVADPSARGRRGHGMWVTCHHKMIAALISGQGSQRAVLQNFPDIHIPPNLTEIIHAQLLTRVLYEAKVLHRRLEAAKQAGMSKRKTPIEPFEWVPRSQVENAKAVEDLSGSGSPERDTTVAYFDFAGIPRVTPEPELVGRDGPFPIPSPLPPISDTPAIPFVQTYMYGRETRIPLYPLASLFPPNLHAHLWALLTEFAPPSQGTKDGAERVVGSASEGEK